MARILLIDDSSTYRVMLRKFLSEAGHQIVGEAEDGRQGIAAAIATRPDLIVMDVDMPDIDGLEATRQIMTRAPTRIVVLSGASRAAGRGAFDAIRAGALEFVPKPEASAMLEVKGEIVSKVGAILLAPHPALAPERVQARPRATLPPGRRRELVVIGVSTGGPKILPHLLRGLPANYAAPIVVAQHMAAGWTDALASHLSEECHLPTREALDGETLLPGTIYIAPGQSDLSIARGLRARIAAAPDAGNHPSVDALFTSAARVCGAKVLAVVLTGMGVDGVAGAEAVKAAGGTVIAQDEATSIVYGMPRAVAAAGLADETLSIEEIAAYLLRS